MAEVLKEDVPGSFVFLVILFVLIFYHSLREKNYVFSVFLISFFFFLLGRDLITYLGVVQNSSLFTNAILVKTYSLLGLSLLFIFIGSLLVNKKKKKILNYKPNTNVRLISKYFFYITVIFYIIELLEKFLFVGSYSYFEYYTIFNSSFPTIFLRISSMSLVFLFIFLSTLPTKKELVFPLSIFSITLILNLLIGARGPIIIGILTLLIYFLYRDTNEINKDLRFLKRRHYLYIILISPFILGFLSYYNSIRFNQTVNFDLYNEILRFFNTIGRSIDVISYSQVHLLKLNELSSSYTFGNIVNYFTRGTFFGIFTGLTPLVGNTYEMAMNGNSLAASLTYIVFPRQYLSGYGLGSSYIAELFVDFGYLGVIFYSLILGMLVKAIFIIRINNWIAITLFLTLVNHLIMLPRGSALGIFDEIQGVFYWFPIFAMIFVSNYSKNVKLK